MKILGARCLNHLTGKTWYVSSLPRRFKNGAPKPEFASFGYTNNIEGSPNPNGGPNCDVAIHLSPYWQRRFLALRHIAPKDSVRLIEIPS